MAKFESGNTVMTRVVDEALEGRTELENIILQRHTDYAMHGAIDLAGSGCHFNVLEQGRSCSMASKVRTVDRSTPQHNSLPIY